MPEPSVPEPPSLKNVPPQHTAWARSVPVALTVAIFLIIFWRIPFGTFWQALSRAQLLPFLALMGSFSLCFFLLDTFVLSTLDRKSTRLNSSHVAISYAVFCLKKKK